MTTMRTRLFGRTLAALLCGGILAGTSRPAHADLEAFWAFNEGAGTTVNDLSGNGNTGTFAASSWTTGQSGAGGDFALNAVGGGQAVSIPTVGNFSAIGTNNAVTLSMWFYGDAALQPRNNTTVQGMNGGNRIVFTHTPWGDQRIYWDSGNAGCCGGNVRISYLANSPTSQYKGQWNYLTLVKNGNTDFSGIYINGTLVASTGGSSANLAGLTSLVLAPDYRGFLDDIAIYSQAINQDTITAMATGVLANGVTYTDALVGSNGYTMLPGTTQVILNGTEANYYLGGTDVQAGRLAVLGSSTLGTGDVTVASGAEVFIANGVTHNNNFFIA
ncbi:MAG: LamG domain-containing protein, partial [Planctomycetales bacterium]|nr:LamG domain-containing protein [Planctomycetales bacterium]